MAVSKKFYEDVDILESTELQKWWFCLVKTEVSGKQTILTPELTKPLTGQKMCFALAKHLEWEKAHHVQQGSRNSMKMLMFWRACSFRNGGFV